MNSTEEIHRIATHLKELDAPKLLTRAGYGYLGDQLKHLLDELAKQSPVSQPK